MFSIAAGIVCGGQKRELNAWAAVANVRKSCEGSLINIYRLAGRRRCTAALLVALHGNRQHVLGML
jgi:hypothetical protein